MEIEYISAAEKKLQSFDPETVEKVESELELITNSPVDRLEPLDESSLYQLNLNNICIIISWHEKAGIIEVIDIYETGSEEESKVAIDSSSLEAYLTEYSELREEVRLMQELQHRRVIGGLTAIGAIMGYTLVSERMLFISLIPVIIGLMFVITARISNATLYLGRHLYDIEQEINLKKFGWESRFGGVIRENERFSTWENNRRWVVAPHLTIQIMVVGAYVIMVAISLVIVQNSDINPILGVSPMAIAGGVYVLVTFLAGVSGYSFLKVMRRVQP